MENSWHILIVRRKDGGTEYFGPFPTFFRANEYGLKAALEEGYHSHKVASLVLPHNTRLNWR